MSTFRYQSNPVNASDLQDAGGTSLTVGVFERHDLRRHLFVR